MLLISWLASQYTSSRDVDDGVPSTVAGWGRTAAAAATLTTCPAMCCNGFVRQVSTALNALVMNGKAAQELVKQS